jgi:hypothetical protein
MNSRFKKVASRAEETRSKSIISSNHMENVKKFNNFSRKSMPHNRLMMQSRESSIENSAMPSIYRTRPGTKQTFERKNHTALGNYNDKPIPTLKKELSTNSKTQYNTKNFNLEQEEVSITEYERDMDNEVSIVNYNSVPISPLKNVRDDLSIGMPPLLEAISQVNESTSRSKKVQSSRDSRMAPAYELEAMIKRFNDSRVET